MPINNRNKKLVLQFAKKYMGAKGIIVICIDSDDESKDNFDTMVMTSGLDPNDLGEVFTELARVANKKDYNNYEEENDKD